MATAYRIYNRRQNEDIVIPIVAVAVEGLICRQKG